MTFPLLEFELDTYGDQTSTESFTVKEEDILVLAQFWRSRSLCFTYRSRYINKGPAIWLNLSTLSVKDQIIQPSFSLAHSYAHQLELFQ